ncbi:MAG TPA: AAA family ATPase [Rhizomicrobium sp.]|nr:AAA family ATPase [Rhizomicrobium sp.]
MEEDQSAVVAFLSAPGSYGPPSDARIERCETHASIVFLAGDRAHKLKRAVCYPYLDYSTAARRKTMCEAELAINRRTAPDLYLEVRPVIRGGSGALCVGTAGEQALDWILVMRRFDQTDLLEEVTRRGELDRQTVRALAELIAEFHAGAERLPRFGGGAGIKRVLEENEQIFTNIIGRPFEPDRVEGLCRSSREWLNRMSPLLEERRASGYVRRCHGDLHLNNICLLEGRPTPFDAIEFSDDLSCIDVFYDFAFLLMDIDRHDLRELANVLLNRYLEKTNDYAGLAALPLFLSCRAAIRAHVIISKAAQTGTDRGLQREAAAYLDAAISYLQTRQSRLVAIGGVSGTGKSTLAYGLAPFVGTSPGAVVLRSDLVRKKLLGADELARLPPEAYTRAITGRVYRTIAELAASLVQSGWSVIADAVHGEEDERAWIEHVAQRLAVPFAGLWLDAERPLLEDRVAGRTKDASDATLPILDQQLSRVSPPHNWRTLDASGDPAKVLAAARAHLDRAGA